MEAIVQAVYSKKISVLSLLDSGPVLSFLFSRITDNFTDIMGPPAAIAFNHLTALTVFSLDDPTSITITNLSLPMLENLTIIRSSPLAYKLLESLSAPNVCRLKLFLWQPGENNNISYLYINNNDIFDLKVPRFPNVCDLTLSPFSDYGAIEDNIICAFPRLTYLTMHNPGLFYKRKEPDPLAPPPIQWLQHLTVDFAFKEADSCWYYKKLQPYGKLDGSSSRLDEFLRWQADVEEIQNHELSKLRSHIVDKIIIVDREEIKGSGEAGEDESPGKVRRVQIKEEMTRPGEDAGNEDKTIVILTLMLTLLGTMQALMLMSDSVATKFGRA
ncbi:hypothetical protein BJ138DRAFT_1099539 [Hygrophoropsis aurantiaca]|uniref:Uncharacterized protein n=1 Tax=Hygrophoropsis aurantiaca TaxID=72124 RepID=A0ACB8ALB5_9AGAM|nr:hypothetical protein BJ138DRAFT_1099539 [Hygrophoropsis aurantiaca]